VTWAQHGGEKARLRSQRHGGEVGRVSVVTGGRGRGRTMCTVYNRVL
jgi:hypothetical protein